jgi:hypothetical protein
MTLFVFGNIRSTTHKKLDWNIANIPSRCTSFLEITTELFQLGPPSHNYNFFDKITNIPSRVCWSDACIELRAFPVITISPELIPNYVNNSRWPHNNFLHLYFCAEHAKDEQRISCALHLPPFLHFTTN